LDTWIIRNIIRVLLETSTLKEGAVVAVEEGTPQENEPSHMKVRPITGVASMAFRRKGR
jgi:hypothetical protein